MPLELVPLPEAELPPAVARITLGASQAKMMAARGGAPLRPAELAIALYQLSFEADPALKAAVEGAPAALPDRVVLPLLGEALPARVLHFFASRLQPTRVEAQAKILYNRATADETFAALARRLEERELEIIIQNEERLLRHPQIVEALYFNKKARMSSVNRVIELCVRNGVQVDGIPAYNEIARSIAGDPGATDPAVADPAFDHLLDATERAEAAGEPPPVDVTAGAPAGAAGPAPKRGEPKEASAEEQTRKGAPIDFTKLKLHEKVRLATLGNAFCRQVLMRDPNKIVAMAAIRSPQITEMEVVRAAGNRALAEDVIRYIGSQRELVKMYPVKLGLVHNPKCPLALSLRMIAYLHPEDLKSLARSRNVPSALATSAKKLAQARGIT